MNDFNADEDGLIVNSIVGKKETYYLVTEEYLKGIRGNSILTDIFLVIASILGGGFFTILITLETASIKDETINLLEAYKLFTGIGGLLFLAFAIIFMIQTYLKINGIKKTKLEENLNNDHK